MNRFVALISLCALTQVAGAHQRVFTEEHAKKVQRFQLYNECVGIAIGYSIDHDLAEGIPGALQLGSLRRDVREKLESASILRHENNLLTHAVRDTVILSVEKVDDRTELSVNCFKIMHDPITGYDAQISTWERSQWAGSGARKDELVAASLALLDEFISEYSDANQDCAPFDVEEEIWGVNYLPEEED